MTVDVRCTIFCDLGTNLGGSLSEDHIDPSNALAKVQGSITLAGVQNLTRGTAVNLGYMVPGSNTVTRFPKRLRVLSSKVDPFEEITTVNVGCKLTLLNDLKPPDVVRADDAIPAWEADLPANMQGIIARPIYAKDVLAKCLQELGISMAGGSVELKSAWLRAEMDLSGGYVNMLNELLLSEGCYGFINTAEQFVIRKVLSAGSTARVLSRDNLLTMEGIEGGGKQADLIRVTWDDAVEAPTGDPLPDIPVLPDLPDVDDEVIINDPDDPLDDVVIPDIDIDGDDLTQGDIDDFNDVIDDILSEFSPDNPTLGSDFEPLTLDEVKGIVYGSMLDAGATIVDGKMSATREQFSAGLSDAGTAARSFSQQKEKVKDYQQPADNPTKDPNDPTGPTGSIFDWSYEESISSAQTFRQSYVIEENGQSVEKVEIVSFAAKSSTRTTYKTINFQMLDGTLKSESVANVRVTQTDNRVGPANPTRWKSKLEKGSPARAADIVMASSKTTYEYTPTKDGLRTWREVTEEYEPLISFGGKLGIKNWFGIDLGTSSTLVSRTETLNDLMEIKVVNNSGTSIGSYEVTKTTVNRWLAWGATQEGANGAAAVAQALEALDDGPRIAGIYELVNYCTALVFDGSETRTSRGRGTIQQLPTKQDLTRTQMTRPT